MTTNPEVEPRRLNHGEPDGPDLGRHTSCSSHCTSYLVKTSSDLTFGVDGAKPLKREQLHFVFESQKLKGLLVLDLSIVEDLKESKRNISVKFLSTVERPILKDLENWLEIIRVKVGKGIWVNC